MKGKERFYLNEGFTLIEIIVAIAIASIVSLVALQIFSFSNTTVNKTEDRSFNQMSVRNASIAITDRARYAKNIEFLEGTSITPTTPHPIPTGGKSWPYLELEYDYIYFDEASKSLVVLYTDGVLPHEEKKYLQSKVNTDISKSYFHLELDPSDMTPPGPARTVEQLIFKVTGKGDKYQEDEQDFTLETTVNLLNSTLIPRDPTAPPKDKKYRGIKYKR